MIDPGFSDLQFRLMKMDLLHRTSTMAFVAAVVNSFVFMVLSWNRESHSVLIAWYSGILFVTVLRLWESRRWMSVDLEKIITVEQVAPWKWRYDAGAFVSGCLWGSLGLLLTPSAQVSQQILISFLLAGTSAGAVAAYSRSVSTVALSIGPMLLPLIVRFSTSGVTMYQWLAVMLVLYLMLMLLIGKNLAQHNDQSIWANLEKTVLVTERDDFAATSKTKTQFLARVSHEIRTPLASILGFAERGLRGPAEERQRDLEVIFRNAKHLLAMINDLLDLSRVESGKLLIEKNWICPAHEISNAVFSAESAAKKKGVTIEVTHMISQKIYTDPNRFRQILINLLANAVNFTDHGTIRVSCESDGQFLFVRVRDTGIGIAPEKAESIFVPFVRGEHDDRRPGTGLGLALSLDLARSLGGTLRLVHSRLGEGSTFEFTVDARAPAGAPIPNIKDEINPATEVSLQGRGILVAEDDDDLKELIRATLEGAGAAVEICDNGAQAMDRALHADYDAVLMDIQMPVMNGDDATERLRRAGYREPIIAVTANASVEEKRRCLALGYSEYVSKPFDARSLIQTIRRALTIKGPEWHKT
jgi:signal transduction histidine kinase/CheY-like chemotaxis protein